MTLFDSPRVKEMQCDFPGEHRVHGSFVAPTQGAAAKAFKALVTLGVSHELDTVVEAKTAGAAGNAITVALTNDATNAKAFINFGTAGCGKLNTIMEFKTAGVAGNLWKVNVVPGSGGAEGVNIEEDVTNKILTIMYETAVSTVTNVETAIGTTTNFQVKTGGTGANVLAAATDLLEQSPLAGGTVSSSISRTGTAFIIHYTATVTTVAHVEALIAALAGADDIMDVKTGGTGTNTLVANTAFAATSLAGGADATVATTYKGKGFTVSYVAAGEYLVTFKDKFTALKEVEVFACLATAADLKVQTGAFDLAAKTLEIHSMTHAGVATDFTANAGDRINLKAIFSNSTGG